MSNAGFESTLKLPWGLEGHQVPEQFEAIELGTAQGQFVRIYDEDAGNNAWIEAEAQDVMDLRAGTRGDG